MDMGPTHITVLLGLSLFPRRCKGPLLEIAHLITRKAHDAADDVHHDAILTTTMEREVAFLERLIDVVFEAVLVQSPPLLL
jgi:hypothetical protein